MYPCSKDYKKTRFRLSQLLLILQLSTVVCIFLMIELFSIQLYVTVKTKTVGLICSTHHRVLVFLFVFLSGLLFASDTISDTVMFLMDSCTYLRILFIFSLFLTLIKYWEGWGSFWTLLASFREIKYYHYLLLEYKYILWPLNHLAKVFWRRVRIWLAP